MSTEFICKWCGKICKNANSLRNHERLCKNNPDHQTTVFATDNPNAKHPWNKGHTKDTDIRIAKQAAKASVSKKGKPTHKQTEATKALLREHALKNGFGGFHMRRGIYYNGIKLDSSYEVILAEDLDKNGIKWVRCSRFPYIKDGKLHYYTPDFYLPDYDIYLEPKNDFLINNINPQLGYTDLEKIQLVMEQNAIKIIVLNKQQLSWEYLKSIIEK